MARRTERDAGRAADAALLARRLAEAGVRHERVVVHENRSVMVHLTRRALRIHRGFAYASDRVLRAVATFLTGRGGARRQAAQRELLAFPAPAYTPGAPRRGRRPPRPRPEDRAVLAELARLHDGLNRAHFGGELRRPVFRISRRMRTRLGEVVAPDGGGRAVIGMSHRHLERDGWEQVRQTLLHEMVHQWQVESGLPLNHGREFRRKARAVGVEPSPRRRIGPRTEPPDAGRGVKREPG